MAEHCYIEKDFKPDSLKWVRKIIEICTSYAAQGYRLSLRQVYYQLVAHHGLPNREQSYKNIGSLLTDARLAGLVDWDLIEDRNRETIENPHWDSPADIVAACAKQFRIRLWDRQPVHVEVMVEKAALEGVLEPVCRRWGVPFTSNRGYSSASAMYENGQRMRDALDSDKRVVILYFGDHDPSGIDMVRDVEDRLLLFTELGEYDKQAQSVCSYDETDDDGNPKLMVRHMALTMGQIQQYNPPPNPAKITDSRAGGYIRRYGRESWELDALEPRVLAQLAEDGIKRELDMDLWREAVAEQDQHRGRISALCDLLRHDTEFVGMLDLPGCPACGSRRVAYIENGQLECHSCAHQYDDPNAEAED